MFLGVATAFCGSVELSAATAVSPGLAGAPWDGLRIAQENESRAAECLQSGARLYWTPVQARFTYRLTWPEIVRLYRLALDMPARNTQPRYNICPTTNERCKI